MSYFLIGAIIIAVLAIVYVWYVTRGRNSISDDATISLDTEDDKLLHHWYDSNIQPDYDFTTTDVEIAVKYLHRIHEIEIDPSLLVVGSNLNATYLQLTQQAFPTTYVVGSDYLFEIRSHLAVNGEIAIVQNPAIRANLQRTSTGDLTTIRLIMNNEMDLMARDFVRETLRLRWEQILALNDPSVLNRGGSYLYLRAPEDAAMNQPILMLNKILALKTTQGARINLLCTNLEFETLMTRWRKLVGAVSVSE
jgi:hypothetical protein